MYLASSLQSHLETLLNLFWMDQGQKDTLRCSIEQSMPSAVMTAFGNLRQD